MKNFFMYTSAVLFILIIVGIIVYAVAIHDLFEIAKKEEAPLGALTVKVVSFSEWIYTYVWMPIVGASGTVAYFARRHYKKKKKEIKEAVS